jgi:hypothetical protein
VCGVSAEACEISRKHLSQPTKQIRDKNDEEKHTFFTAIASFALDRVIQITVFI